MEHSAGPNAFHILQCKEKYTVHTAHKASIVNIHIPVAINLHHWLKRKGDVSVCLNKLSDVLKRHFCYYMNNVLGL